MALPGRTLITFSIIFSLGFQACYHSAHHESDIQDDPARDAQDLVEDLGLEPELDQVDVLPETSDPDLDVPEEIEIPPEPENTWIRIYSGEIINTPSHLRATFDGGYVFAATGYTPEGFNNSAVVKLDGEGFVQWAKMVDLGFAAANGIVLTPDGGFGLLLVDVRFEDNTASGLIRLDENGNMLWARVITNSYGVMLEDLEATGEGGFILGGSAIFGTSSILSMVLLDEHGAVIWNTVQIANVEGFSLNDIVQAEDGGFAAAGNVLTIYPEYDWFDTWVVKLDATGNVEWQERISGTHELVAYAIAPAPGNGFVIGGRGGFSYYGALAFGPVVMRLDEDGTLLWQKIIKDTSDGEILGLCPAYGGGFIGAGMAAAGTTGYDATLLKIMDDGAVAWIRGYCGADYDMFYHVQQTVDGGYVAVGPTYLFDSFTASPWVAKINSLGTGMTGCPEGLGVEMMLTVEDTDFTAERTSALPEDSRIEIINVDLAVEDIEVEVVTLCEGE